MRILCFFYMSLLVLSACSAKQALPESSSAPVILSGETDTALFAGGCFWCIEADFEKVTGVISAVSGYTGGETINPNYRQVTYGRTGHYEAVEVTFDPQIISYEELLRYFWHHIDPTDPDGQFCDKGESYRTAIFSRPEQMAAARDSKSHVLAHKPFKADIVTPVLPAVTFYVAEDYHQDFYKKQPSHYQRYRLGCGRDARVRALWGESHGPNVQKDPAYGSGSE